MVLGKSTHRILLGWLFVGIAMLLAVFLVFTWKKAFNVEDATHTQDVLRYTVIVALMFFSVGLALLLEFRYAAWVCLPFSLFLLIYFPIGTLLGGYYLWYFWRYVFRQKAG